MVLSSDPGKQSADTAELYASFVALIFAHHKPGAGNQLLD